MAAGSLDQEQIRHFREVYSQYSEGEGSLNSETFPPAVHACLERMTLAVPLPPEHLSSEFERIGAGGSLSWPQFFQVLIHINLTYGLAATSLAMSQSEELDREPEISVEGGRGGVVAFAEETIDYPPPEEGAPPIPPHSSAWGRTLRRGGAFVGRVVGNFFGVTEESQHGSANTVGWEEVSERRAEEGDVGFLTLGRHPSVSRHFSPSEPPPDYPGVSGARSFNPNELSDSDDEDEAFISPAPPSYNDVVAQPPALVVPGEWGGGRPSSGVTRVSVYTAEDEALGLQRQQQQQYLPPTWQTTPQQQQQPPPPRQPEMIPAAVPPREELIHDKNQAWEYYQKFVKAERRLRQRRNRDDANEFFGSGDGGRGPTYPSSEERRGTVRRDRLQSIDQPPNRRNKSTKLQRQSSLVRKKVESLPSFWPVFIILVTIAQVAGMIVLLVIYGTEEGLAPVRIAPEERNGVFPSLKNISGNEEVTYFRSVNLWFGLSPPNMIAIGAKFTPCMRIDFGIRRRNSRDRDMEGNLGCCKNQQNVGTVPFRDCAFSDITSTNTTATQNGTGFDPNIECSNNQSAFFPNNFYPCCISITGQCKVMHMRECMDRGGWFHTEVDSCREVNCFKDICGFDGFEIGDEDDNPLLPTANQWWRWILSVFIHLGVIHIIIVMPIQLYVGIKIERTIGWLRVGLIYIISGFGGNIVSAIFIPYEVNAGASGAVFGLLGVLFVELFQFWQIVDHAFFELLKLSGFVVFLLLLGTLPYVDNMAHIGGLLFGVVSAIVFVPYITFGKWDAFRKRLLIIICVPLLLLLAISGLITFYIIPTPDFCEECRYINCVPYTSDLCPDEYSNPDPDVFSL